MKITDEMVNRADSVLSRVSGGIPDDQIRLAIAAALSVAPEVEEHPVKQAIDSIEIDTIPEVQGSYRLGRNGVTSIEACTKSGMHADIPYVRVWAGNVCLAEFCQHNIVGVYFSTPTSQP